MSDTFHIGWYATGLRGDQLERTLADVTPTALRYGATGWSLHRSADDRYKFLQIVHFADKPDFERWWHGQEMETFRVVTSGWSQVPVLYVPHDLIGAGYVEEAPVENGTGAPTPEPVTPAEA